MRIFLTTVGQRMREGVSANPTRLANRFGHTAPRRLSMTTSTRKRVLEVTAAQLAGSPPGDKQTTLVLRDISEEQLSRSVPRELREALLS